MPGSAGNFPSNHAWEMRNRTAGNTMLMHTASNLYDIKMATLGWSGSCNTGIKVTLAELASPGHVTRPFLWVVLSHSFATESLGICRFRDSFNNNCHACSLHMKMLVFASFTVRTKECNLFTSSFWSTRFYEITSFQNICDEIMHHTMLRVID